MFLKNTSDLFDRLSASTAFLASVTLVVAALFVVSSYWLYSRSHGDSVQMLKQDIENRATTIASSIEEYFRGKKASVELMADFVVIPEFLSRATQETLQTDKLYPEVRSLLKTVSGTDKAAAIAWLASLKDDFSLSYNDISWEKDGWITRERDWFPGTMEADGIYFSDPYWDFETKSICVSLIQRVYTYVGDETEQKPERELVGVAGLDLFFPPIKQIMGRLALDDVFIPLLISNDGSILYHPNEMYVFDKKLPDIDPVLKSFVERIALRKNGTEILTLQNDNRSVYFSFVPVSGTNWSVAIIWNQKDAEKTISAFKQSLIRSLLLNLILFLIPVGLFVAVVANRTHRFLDMKRLYDLVVNQMQVGIAIIDPNQNSFILKNPAYDRFLGLPQAEHTSFSSIQEKLNLSEAPAHTIAAIETISGFSAENGMSQQLETPEIGITLDGTTRYYTHFFTGFRDQKSRKLLLSVLTDVSEMKQMQETLRIAKEIAETASRAKSSFLANMSHEIRTPMNGIIGITDLLSNTELNDKQQEYIEHVRNSAAALLTVINDILDHSKIEAGKLLIESYNFDLLKLLHELTFSLSISAQSKGIVFEPTIDSCVPHFVQGDGNRLRQILSNFLGNAVKFTDKGSVKIRVFPTQDNRIRFEIQDSGIGISAEKQAILFQPFAQADSTTTRKYGGTGLGLAIARSIILMMHGELGFESVLDSGSLFWFELPLPRTEFEKIDKKNTSDGQKSQALRILLVDDVKINLIVLSSLLQQWGHVTDMANNGLKAIELMKTHRYDIVFMDCQMPEMDGYESTQKIRDVKTGILEPSTPIIAVTAHAMIGDKEKCIAAGMDDYISKPIDQAELRSKLALWVAAS